MKEKLVYDLCLCDGMLMSGKIGKVGDYISLYETCPITGMITNEIILHKDKNYTVKITDNNRMRLYEEVKA